MGQSDFNEMIADFWETVKDQLETIANEAQQESSQFFKSKADDIKRYSKSLAAGKITAGEFQDLLRGLMSINVIQYNRLSAKTKVRAQELINRLSEVIIEGLFKMI